jgi:hypothetical protein
MTSEATYPTANGKRFTLHVDTQADVPAYQDWAHTDRLDNLTVMEVSIDGGNTWSYAKLDNPVGKWACVGWSFTWEDVTAGEYTLRCRAKDERGNMSKDDDSAHDYYAMDITKAQYVDVNVYPEGTLAPLNKIEVPVQFPSL